MSFQPCRKSWLIVFCRFTSSFNRSLDKVFYLQFVSTARTAITWSNKEFGGVCVCVCGGGMMKRWWRCLCLSRGSGHKANSARNDSTCRLLQLQSPTLRTAQIKTSSLFEPGSIQTPQKEYYTVIFSLPGIILFFPPLSLFFFKKKKKKAKRIPLAPAARHNYMIDEKRGGG